MNNHKRQIEFDSVQRGFVSLLPISFFVVIFGAAFGLAAAQSGLSQVSAMLMSFMVFAGASQFGVLELWGNQVPILALIVTVFAINARHLLIGATLYPHIRSLRPVSRYSIMLVASDANWAMSMRAFSNNEPSKGIGILLGGGLALWFFWIVGTWIGLYFGNAIQDPSSLGIDMVMGCFLLTMVLEGKTNNRAYAIWTLAAISSIGAFFYLPENSHVIVGALTGGIAGVLIEGENNEH
ncbi:AzlC family ABC transporter permease [Vibrio ostreicida]|uniref:AzlC family ABC transporter permease n=1 Tax=Vibrio ostreicida TaxID=526588 RepID=A0ABT8BTG4_9VIBR|nr:AzlC family ABC transporter permease [Vibrio ostreicida]MDN3609969.1 AzlC family ABC transporter permease [Vibrio ostreicida]NPD10394.1 branched-chain amino acid ABC transporter permease [Vibrio ostreicida]